MQFYFTKGEMMPGCNWNPQEEGRRSEMVNMKFNRDNSINKYFVLFLKRHIII
jgi:hypothetical protein